MIGPPGDFRRFWPFLQAVFLLMFFRRLNSGLANAASWAKVFGCSHGFRPQADPRVRDHLTDLNRQNIMKLGLGILALALGVFCLQPATASAQTYSIDWYKIAGGGGTSTGGVYSVSGTIGQPDASGAMTGGNYSLTGGFWAFIQVIQTPGAPALYISHSGNTVTLYWLNVTGWNLHQNGNITTPIASWAASGSPTLTNGTNYFTITNPTGNVFFQLSNP
jgi:hypothetical protein